MKAKLLLVLLFIFMCSLNGFSQSGELDTTFGVDGKLTTAFGSNNNMANAIAFQPDGKFLVGGTCLNAHGENDFALVRYNSNGTFDLTFGIEGKVTTQFLEVNNDYSFINSIYVLQDGKIMVIGSSQQLGSLPVIAIAKYNSNGTIDSDFGSNGKILSSLLPFTRYGNKLAFEPDGKFLITSIKRYNSDTNNYTGVERYTQDGVLDPTFGIDGLAVASYGTGDSIPASIAIQPDGKIVIVGNFFQANSNTVVIAALRFNSDGTLDNGFSGDGKVTTPFGAGTVGEGMDVSIDANGKVIVAGMVLTPTSRNFGLIHYNSDGSLDTSFDTDGKVLSAFDLEDDYNLLNSVTKQPDGKFLAVADLANLMLSTSDFVIWRFSADGSFDTTFGTNGKLITNFSTGLDEAQSAGVSPNGEIFVVGTSMPATNDHTDFAIAKYDGNGSLEATFNADGKLITTFENSNDQLKTLLVLPDDKILAVGTSGFRKQNNSVVSDFAISKYNSNGSLDTTFGTSGKIVSNLGEQVNAAVTAALQADGKIVVSNMYYNPNDSFYSNQILRYSANGALDLGFGSNGKIAVDFSVSSILIQPDGKIIIAGNQSVDSVNSIIVKRFNSDGTADTDFGNLGIVTLIFGTFNYGPSLLLQPDGKVIVSNSTLFPDLYNGSPLFATTRLTTDGDLDSAFGTNGTVLTLIADACFARACFLGPDGKIIVAGLAVNELISFTSVRYDSTGAIDTTYGVDGISISPLWNDYRVINNILLQPDGKFLVALSKQNEDRNTYDFKVRRFNTDGTYDDAFGASYGVSTYFYNGYDEAFSMVLQSDNKIVTGGTTDTGLNTDFALARHENVIDLGDEEFTQSSTLVLYPNPAKDILNIKSESGDQQILDYKIYNMLGQIVHEGSEQVIAIDTRNFSRGIYTVAIRTSTATISKKFIKE